jgi:hypothetical protein
VDGKTPKSEFRVVNQLSFSYKEAELVSALDCLHPHIRGLKFELSWVERSWKIKLASLYETENHV